MSNDKDPLILDLPETEWASENNPAQENRFWDMIGAVIVFGCVGIYMLLTR